MRELDIQVGESIGWSGGDVPKFTEDWSVSGPLIERFGLALFKFPQAWKAYGAYERLSKIETASYPTALEALCRLVVELHQKGRLRAA